MKCLVLAGGAGDRLWPLSRKDFPKQFIKSEGELSLFQETITRNIPYCDEFVIVTNKKYENIVKGQLQQFQGISYRIILETVGNGTAGAIAVATAVFSAKEEVLVVPADTVMGQDGYSDAIYKAKEYIKQGQLCLFGTTATSASTEYGYIQTEGDKVIRFLEKPTSDLADKIFWQENTLWNCGMLMCSNKILKEELEKYCGKILMVVSEAVDNSKTTKHGSILLESKDDSRVSFERTVLEKSDRLASIKIYCDWNRVSDFKAYEDLYGDGSLNTIFNKCDDVSVINKSENQLIVVNELDNLLVVNTPDALYISDKDKADEIKGIIDTEGDERDYFVRTPVIYRPWGTRELIQEAEGYRVRKISIYPGMQLSSHIHEKRNENYTVINGVLTVIFPDETVEINSGEIVNIEAGKEHRLQNNTDETIVVIEVDTGKIIDEGDMVQGQKSFAKDLELPSLYRLHPAYKDYLWGGNTLVEKYGKDSTYEITAESWELSAHPDGPCKIVGGDLDGTSFDHFIRTYGERVCGWKSKTFDRFPVLIKFIDARNALSVQIHPNDDYAFPVENEFGKNEMWYVMDAAPGSYLYCGLSKECSKEEIRERIENVTLTEVLNKIEVKPGDVVFVPAGTIHAIGAGILICEIQQNSNCTYRMYDYGRRDKNGNLRELHIDKALDVVNVDPYMPELTGFSDAVTTAEGSTERVLSRCKYFQVTDYKILDHEIIQVDDSSFKAFVVLEGNCVIRCGDEECQAKPGDSFFVSAGRKRVHIDGECEVIVTNI